MMEESTSLIELCQVRRVKNSVLTIRQQGGIIHNEAVYFPCFSLICFNY